MKLYLQRDRDPKARMTKSEPGTASFSDRIFGPDPLYHQFFGKGAFDKVWLAPVHPVLNEIIDHVWFSQCRYVAKTAVIVLGNLAQNPTHNFS